MCRKETQPAFYHAYEYVRGQKLGAIRLNPVVADQLAKDPLREALHPSYLLMLIKPKAWLTLTRAGTFITRVGVFVVIQGKAR